MTLEVNPDKLFLQAIATPFANLFRSCPTGISGFDTQHRLKRSGRIL
jgi:hypothetical protein